MAGSYLHCVGKGLKPYENPCALLDNMGDAFEAIEEMLFMIDYLAGGSAERKKEARDAYYKSVNPEFTPVTFEEFMAELSDL